MGRYHLKKSILAIENSIESESRWPLIFQKIETMPRIAILKNIIIEVIRNRYELVDRAIEIITSVGINIARLYKGLSFLLETSKSLIKPSCLKNIGTIERIIVDRTIIEIQLGILLLSTNITRIYESKIPIYALNTFEIIFAIFSLFLFFIPYYIQSM